MAEILTPSFIPRDYYNIQPTSGLDVDKPSLLKIGTLMTAFGNHELKALTLVLSSAREPLTKHHLRGALVRFTGDVWNLHEDTVDDYARTFRRFGGLIESLPQTEGLPKWQLTEKGSEAAPIAAYLLLESYRHSIPLIPTFGSSTGAGESKAPINNLLIYHQLAFHNRTLSVAKIADEAGMPRGTANTRLLLMKQAGLINADSLNPDDGKGKINYKLERPATPEDFRGIRKAPYLIEGVYDVIAKAGGSPLGIDEVVEKVTTGDSYDPRFKKLKQIRIVVNTTLGALRAKGVLSSNFTAVTDQSHIGFKKDNNLGAFIAETVPSVTQYLDGDEKMARKFNIAYNFITSEDEIAQMMREFFTGNARLFSGWAPEQIGSKSQRTAEVYSYLKAHPNSKTDSIAAAVDSSKPETKHALLGLILAGEATRQKAGRHVLYSVLDQTR